MISGYIPVDFEIETAYDNTVKERIRRSLEKIIKNEGKKFKEAIEDKDFVKSILNDYIVDPKIYTHFFLELLPEKIKDNKEVMLKAVQIDGYTYCYISDRLKKDKEILIEAVKNYGYALEWASDELKNDKDIVLTAVKKHGGALQFASKNFYEDKEIILTAVKNDGITLLFASENLKDDEEIVWEAIKKDGKALNFASDRLKLNSDLVNEAKKTYPEIINVYNKLREKTLFDNLEDRGIGYLGVLELLCKEIESYGEEVEKRCCFDDTTSWFETKKIHIEYYTENKLETIYLWDSISELSNKLSEALRYEI